MATTQHFYSGTGSQTSFPFTFEYLKNSEVKVKVASVLKTESTDYNIVNTNIVFATAPASGTNNVQIYRDTDVESGTVIYAAGSSIRASDLNDNQKQLLHAIQELELVSPNSSGLVLSTGTKNDIKVNSSGNWEIVDDQVENKHLAPNAVGNTEIIDDSIAEVKLDIHNTPATGKILKYTSNGMEWGDESITVPTQITIADESTDTACFPLFATDATGNKEPKTGSNLTFNSATGNLGATSFTGTVTGDVTGNVTGNITGNVIGTGSIDSTVTATTQATADNSTKIATTAFVKANVGESQKPTGLKLGSLRPNVSTLSLYSSSLHPTSIAKYGVGNSQTSNILGLYSGNYISNNGKSYIWGYLHSDVHHSFAIGGTGTNPMLYTPLQQQLRLPGYFMRAVGGYSLDSKFLTDLNGTSLGYTTISQPKIINTYLNRANQYFLTENGMLFGSGANDYSLQGNSRADSTGRSAALPVQFYNTSGQLLLNANRPKIKQFSMSSTGDDFPNQDGKGDRIALDTDGNVYTWGMNQFGQCGRGFNDAGTGSAVRNKAQKITHSWDGTPIYVYAEGGESSSVFVITSTGKLYAWGHNDQGQLGINNVTDQNVPQEVTAITSDLKTAVDAGAKVVHVLATGGHTVYRRTYVLTDQGKVYACGHSGSPTTSADHGTALGYHVSDNADQIVFNECTLVTAQLTYTNEKIVSLWSTGGDTNTNYVITDGGTQNKPRVISWGHNNQRQLGRYISTTATADASSVGVWTPGEIQFQHFGDMERMSTSGTTVNDVVGTMYGSEFEFKHKFGRPVAIVSNKHQSVDQCMVVLIDDLGQLYVAGDNEEHAMVNYPEFDNDSNYNGTSSSAHAFVPVWQQPEPITDLCFNHYGDGNAAWTAIGASGTVYTGGEGIYGTLGLGGMYSTTAEITYNTGGFHPLAIST